MAAKRRRAKTTVAKRSAGGVPRVTYATLTITPKDDLAYERAVAEVTAKLGSHFAMYVNGQEWKSTGEEMAHPSPVDGRVIVSHFPNGHREDSRAAVDAAVDAFPRWSSLPWKNRLKVLRKAADILYERRYEQAAWMAFEVGKNRSESLAEINESIELIRYYCDQMEVNKGFVKPLEPPAPKQETVSVLRPYGVWGVISPWNFPLSLAAGMVAGALAAGNTVVFKPSSDSPVLGHELTRALSDAGIPSGVFNMVTGSGGTVGAELLDNPKVDGLIFTGSKAVGVNLYHNFAKDYPKPVIAEMGGKNPAIVTEHADLEVAAEGVMRAAFGFGGQKCSACSRVYVAENVKSKFLQLLNELTRKYVKVGHPTRKDTFMGPLINKAAINTYLRAVETARRDNGGFTAGGNVLNNGEFEYGNFVEPTIVNGLPKDHPLFKEELFVPFLLVADVGSLDDALRFANDTEYGLCAGIYSRDRRELEAFFERIQAGVLYANRKAGATTGAWPGVNSFGGWKGSGSTGKGGLGPYYVQQFMHEQSRWIVK